jgi:hypothetical protein
LPQQRFDELCQRRFVRDAIVTITVTGTRFCRTSGINEIVNVIEHQKAPSMAQPCVQHVFKVLELLLLLLWLLL